MKTNFYYVLTILSLFSCNSEHVNDCIQTTGAIVQQEFQVSTSFEAVIVNRDIELIIKEGPEISILVETGENLLNDIEVTVINNQLILNDHNSCNYVRDYGITKIYLTAPTISEIRNSSQYDITSNGILTYPELRLISEDFNSPGSFTVGDFRLQLASDEVVVISNNLSSFYLSGTTDLLNIGFFSGAGRFEGEDLLAQTVTIFHRGSNDMIVNPQLELTGELRGTGDLIAVNEPPLVVIDEYYTGQLIFQD